MIDIGSWIAAMDAKEETDTSERDHLVSQEELFLDYVLRKDTPYRRNLKQQYDTGSAPLTGPQGLRKQLAAIDLAYFGRAYLSHYFIRQSPEFHEELDDIWIHGVMKDILFRTNTQTAYNVGHYLSMMEVAKERPYWMYVTAGDENVRDTHAAMHGTVWAADDPIWDVWYPPNGFGCRCHIRSYTAKQVADRKLTVQERTPTYVDTETGEIGFLSPDRGFTTNPAKQEWKPDIGKLSPAVRKAYNAAKQKP